MDWPKPGTTVTPLKRTEAYYSGYGGRPECFLGPGERAVVVSVDIPPVTGRRGNYLTADFVRDSMRWTVALWPSEYSVVDGDGRNARVAARRIARAGGPAPAAPYKEALAEAERAGASRAVGDAELAQACLSLSRVHAVNPEMLYNGAKANGLSGIELARLAHDDLGTFAFVPFDTKGELIRRPSAKHIIGLHERWLDEDMDAVTRVAEELDCHGGEPTAKAVPEALDGATVYRGFGVGEGEDWRRGFRHGGTPGGVSHSLMRSTALSFARGTGYMQGGASGPVPVIVRMTVRAADVNGGETAVRWSGDHDTDPCELARMLWDHDTAYGEFEVVLRKLPASRYELEWTSAEHDPAGATHRTRRSGETTRRRLP